MIEFIQRYWPEVLFGALSALYGRTIAHLRRRLDEQDCLKRAMQALLRDSIVNIYNTYAKESAFPLHERENLTHLTREYYALGGNGVIRDLEAKLLALDCSQCADEDTKGGGKRCQN